jgi:DNA modification methylase
VLVTEPSDLWICGDHHLYCGNALNPTSYRALMRGLGAHVAFTDPPYNVPNTGHVSKRANVREFAMASGDMTSEEFTDFLKMANGLIAANVVDGAVIYECMDWRHLGELFSATRPYFGKPKNMIVWVKTNGGQGTFYRSQHEHIAVYVAGKSPPTNNFKLGERGRYRTNVWRYAGFNTFGRDRDSTLSAHPTVKPVALVVDALRDCSKRGEIVLDPFGGSGTTMIAAERTGRMARLMEIDPIYCDVILRRWQTFSGKDARLAESNETFAQVQARRAQARVAQESL